MLPFTERATGQPVLQAVTKASRDNPLTGKTFRPSFRLSPKRRIP